MKSHRETFNIVYNAILQQGSLSRLESSICVYRGPDGLKCAAGHLIPDNRYNSKFERNACFITGDNRGYVCKEQLEICDQISEILRNEGHDPEFVLELQNIHDRAQNFDHWKRKMQDLVF